MEETANCLRAEGFGPLGLREDIFEAAAALPRVATILVSIDLNKLGVVLSLRVGEFL